MDQLREGEFQQEGRSTSLCQSANEKDFNEQEDLPTRRSLTRSSFDKKVKINKKFQPSPCVGKEVCVANASVTVFDLFGVENR